MNYLAHSYLSGESEGVLVGNFIGDSVKGNKYLEFTEDVQKGIIIHRRIDSFTDVHPLARSVSQRFRQGYGRYSGIVTDMIFDHFLAKYWDCYSTYSLRDFAKRTHSVLLSGFNILPAEVKGFLPFLIYNRRLESYATADGIKASLDIMARHTNLPDESGFAMEVLSRDFLLIRAEFETFFSELVRFVEETFGIDIKKPLAGCCDQ